MFRNILMLLLLPVCNLFGEDSIELLKTIAVPGGHRDLSELDEELGEDIPHDLFGGISALEYLGRDNLYLALPDRGPLDGAVDWSCRIHLVRISIADDKPKEFSIQKTAILRDKNRIFSGLHTRFKATTEKMARLDPEGIRLRSNDRFLLTDEYGPHLLEFDIQGKLQREIPVPDHFKVATPCKTKAEENAKNRKGRQGNRGLEGLAISGDKQKLFGLFQSPLLQDCERAANGKPTGKNCRLIEFNLFDGSRSEYVYQLDHPKNKLNEILAIDDNRFLVIERDGESGEESKYKRVVMIDLASATKLDNDQKLPPNNLPADIRPVAKRPFIDLLDKKFGLGGKDMPEKIESLTFGPRLEDGRQTLLIASDNDFKTNQPTYVYCFAVDKRLEFSKEVTTR